MESRTGWLVVAVGCALLAAGLASEEMSMLHDLADPPPELPVYDPRADSLSERTVSLNPHANATKGSVNTTVEPKLKVGPLDPGYGQANAELAASAMTPELTVSLHPHANATKGFVDGPTDPGHF
jgi:hypothetical protein